MLLTALLIASSTAAPDCSMTRQAFGTGSEYRPGSPAEVYAAIREADACERHWFDFHYAAVDRLVDRGLDAGSGPAQRLELVVDPELEVLVETARHAYSFSEQSAGAPLAGESQRPRRVVPGRRSDYRLLCRGPCSVELSTGRHYFAMGRQGEVLAEVKEPLDLSGPARISADMSGHTTARTVGAWGIIVGILGTGVTAGLVVATSGAGADPGLKTASQVACGASLGLAAVGAGVLALFWSDSISFSVD